MFASARYSTNLASLRCFSRWAWMSSGEEPGGHASGKVTAASSASFPASLLVAVRIVSVNAVSLQESGTENAPKNAS